VDGGLKSVANRRFEIRWPF